MKFEKNKDEVFKRYEESYSEILERFYPSKGGTGFVEKNLTVNFVNAYKKVNENDTIISWFEFQWGIRNNKHIDAIIINYSAKEIIFIESKRFSNLNKKIEEIKIDVDRINELFNKITNEMKDRLDDETICQCKNGEIKYIGIVLADIWNETKSKCKIINAFRNNKFAENIMKTQNNTYYEMLIPNLKEDLAVGCNDKGIKGMNYFLSSFYWFAN